MRLSVVIRRVEEKARTTRFELVGESPPMTGFYVNRERLAALTFDTGEMVLTISSKPFGDGEAMIAFPPVPFFKEHKDVVRYQHTTESKGKARFAPSTFDLPVTQAYVDKDVLKDDMLNNQTPIYFGVSAVNEVVIEDEKQDVTSDIAVEDEIFDGVAIAAFDDFLRESIQVKRGGRLTSRQIWAVWAARWNAESDAKTVAGVQFREVSTRFYDVFKVRAEPTPTRIEGRSQRYWSHFTIQPVSD